MALNRSITHLQAHSAGLPGAAERIRSVIRFVVIFLAAVPLAGFGPPVITDGGYPPIRLYPDQIAAMTALEHGPQVTASAAFVTDVDSGQTLYALHAQDPLPPASTAKLVTALVVLQRASLDSVVTVSPTAAATEGSRMGLYPGETLTVHELLYGLLLPSGNDAAVALAEHVAGSESAFVELMNETAAGLGMAQTHFATADGQDVAGQVTTAADLALAAKAALQNPTFAQLVATSSATVPGHVLASTNELLGAYPGVDGVKTGTSDAAGECLVISVNRGGHRLLVVLLGSSDRYTDARALLDFAVGNWAWRPAALPDDALAWTPGPDGELYRLRAEPGSAGSAGAGAAGNAGASSDVFLPSWQWGLVHPVRVLDPSIPVTSTLPVGVLRLVYGDKVLATTPLGVWPSP